MGEGRMKEGREGGEWTKVQLNRNNKKKETNIREGVK